jgi:endogenous inhibitor of DNA gyrase (YacG/DUF329 family)
VRCPTCEREFDPSGSAALPFCGQRCRQIDLARWLGERFTLPVYSLEEDGEETEETES